MPEFFSDDSRTPDAGDDFGWRLAAALLMVVGATLVLLHAEVLMTVPVADAAPLIEPF